MPSEPVPGDLGESSGVECEHCGEAEYCRILGLNEDMEKDQFSCPNCGDGKYLSENHAE